MKNKKLFTGGLILSLSGLLALGAAVGLSSGKESAEVKAAASSGNVYIKFDATTNWSSYDAKIAIYFWNDNGGGTGVKTEDWSNVYELDSSDSAIFYEIPYSLSFEPANMIISRQSSSSTTGSKGTWGNNWTQTNDLSFAKCAYVPDDISSSSISGASSWNQSASINSSSVSYGVKVNLSTFGINASKHLELSGQATLIENEKFKVVDHNNVWRNAYGTPSQITSNFTLEEEGDHNIVCLVPGTYNFYYDVVNESVWITSQDIADADGWAAYFNEHVGCDPDGVALPSGWSDVSARYATLSNGAKDVVYGGTADPSGDNLGRALATYDYAVAHHSGLTRFIVNSGDTPRAAIYLPSIETILVSNIESSVSIVLIASLIGLTAVGAVVYLKVRKHD